MSEHAQSKVKALNGVLDEIAVITAEIEADEGKNDTPDNRQKLEAKLAEGEALRKSIEQDAKITGLKSFLTDPATEAKSATVPTNGGGERRHMSLGEAFVESDSYKSMTSGGTVERGARASIESKGFLFGPSGRKATFDSTDTGLTSGLTYLGPSMVEVEQQRLYVRDLLPVGETTLNTVNYIKETSFTNAATAVLEEGLKPEATFATEDASAPVRKIAVIGRVTNEMFADFPMMRDYVNNRLRFMVLQEEEDQLLNGDGNAPNIDGITNAGIQTQAISTDSMADAIYKAADKIRTIGFFEPDAVVIHPTDYQAMRLAQDGNDQYYGGGYFTGAYGNGSVPTMPPIWGMRTVVTTAIAQGDPLVGAFRMGAQIWQREGISVDTTETDGEDWRYNRIAVRVEERLALAVYRPLAFCQVITT